MSGVSGIKGSDLQANEGAAMAGMPKDLAQLSQAMKMGASADQIVQACGSAQNACSDLMKIASADPKMAAQANAMIKEIQQMAQAQGAMAGVAPTEKTTQTQIPGVDSKERGAVV